jgi:FkbM family methyltransferase
MFYQSRNNTQCGYYKAWAKAGIKGSVHEELTGIKSSGNHYKDRYLRMADLHKQLHPYQFINKDYTVIACGCNDQKIPIGTSQPLIFSTIAKHVIVLEPDPVNIKALGDYITKHKIKNITIVPKAVWNTETMVEFTVCGRTASNQIGKLGRRGRQIKVPTVTFDQLMAKYGKIDFIHLTINGLEPEALEGAIEMLKTDTEVSVAMIHSKHVMFKKRMRALNILRTAGYYIGCADGPPRAWQKQGFYFAVGTKDKDKLAQLRFHEEEVPW